MDEELFAIKSDSQYNVPMPDCLNQKFAINKKEVNLQSKLFVGSEVITNGTS